MTEQKSKTSNRNRLIVASLAILILTGFSITAYYTDFFGQVNAFFTGKTNLKYPEQVKVVDIEDMNGIFPDYDVASDNVTQTTVLSVLAETGDIEVTQTLKATATPMPTVKSTLKPTAVPTVKSTAIPTTIVPTSRPTTIPTVIPTTVSVRDYSKPWQVAANCPASTQNCVPCYVGESLCRIETGETRGFKGWACQNNNPGNIRPINNYNDTNDFRNRLIKAMGGTPSCGIRTGTGGSYMVFTDYTTGFNSLKAYISAINAGMHTSYTEYNVDGSVKGVCGNCSLTFFMNKWANNPSEGYKQTISNYLGVDPNTTTLMSLINAGRLTDLANGIKTAEGFIVR